MRKKSAYELKSRLHLVKESIIKLKVGSKGDIHLKHKEKNNFKKIIDCPISVENINLSITCIISIAEEITKNKKTKKQDGNISRDNVWEHFKILTCIRSSMDIK